MPWPNMRWQRILSFMGLSLSLSLSLSLTVSLSLSLALSRTLSRALPDLLCFSQVDSDPHLIHTNRRQAAATRSGHPDLIQEVRATARDGDLLCTQAGERWLSTSFSLQLARLLGSAYCLVSY